MGRGRAARMLEMTLVNSASLVQEGTPLDVVQDTLVQSTRTVRVEEELIIFWSAY